MTALPFAVNSAAIDSKCRLVLHSVPWRAGSRDLFRESLVLDVDFVSVYLVWFQSVKHPRRRRWGIPFVPHPIPSSRQIASTRFFTLDGMVMGVPHSRVVSPGHLLVASMPIFEPGR